MDMRQLVGRNVRRIRLSKGLTQEQFADRSGFSQQYLSDLERVMRKATPQVVDAAPTEARLTDYDHAHLPIYMRLLDTADAGAPWSEVAGIVLGINPIREPDRAMRAYDSHLARARWMMDHGYRHLLQRA